MDTPFVLVSIMDYTLIDVMMDQSREVGDWLGSDGAAAVGTLLIACFGLAVGFIAYKLIKRALNKA